MFKWVIFVFLFSCTLPAEPVEIIDTVYQDTVYYSGEYRNSGFSIFWDVLGIQQASDSLRFQWRYRVVKYDDSLIDSVWALGFIYTNDLTDVGQRAQLLAHSRGFVEAPDGTWDYLDYVLSTHWGGWFAEKYWPIDPGMGVESK